MDDLANFLVKAKTNTYAGKGEEKKLSDGTKELEYKEGDFLYRDRYYGFNPFIGEEIIFCKDEAIWGMNYFGFIVSKEVDPKKVYEFLRKALAKTTPDKPFRGPVEFKEGDFVYNNIVEGTIDKFNGTEKIFYKDQEAYILEYHGGELD